MNISSLGWYSAGRGSSRSITGSGRSSVSGESDVQDRRQRPPLRRAVHRLRGGLAVAAQGIGVLETADDLGGGLQLVAVMEVERDQDLLEQGERLARGDVVLAEMGEPDAAHRQLVAQALGGVRAVVPEVGDRARRALGAGVLVGEEDQSRGRARPS